VIYVKTIADDNHTKQPIIKFATNIPPSKATVKNHFVYVLRCRNGDLYTGYTIDPGRRLEQHKRGKASKFTRSRLPVQLVHLETFNTRSEALKREFAIKHLSRMEKLRIISRTELVFQRPPRSERKTLHLAMKR